VVVVVVAVAEVVVVVVEQSNVPCLWVNGIDHRLLAANVDGVVCQYGVSRRQLLDGF
jgi:hypothetical protein